MAVLPKIWLSPVEMDRIIVHWTAGTHKASANDKNHYHILVEADGRVIRGNCPISGNAKPGAKGKKANHTLNCNTRSIGVSLCCMGGAVEAPFDSGKWPMTEAQWSRAVDVVAELASTYNIPIGPKTVLSHAEVQKNLKIKQKGKWDIARLSFEPSVKGAAAIGDLLRGEVSAKTGNIKAVTFMSPTQTLLDENKETKGEVDEPGAAIPGAKPLDEKPIAKIDPPKRIAADDDKKTVMAAQVMLNKLGYYHSEIDGNLVPGGLTLAAISQFQNKNMLQVTGQLDNGTLERLKDPNAIAMSLPGRAETTKREIVKKYESTKALVWSKLASLWAGIAAAFTGVVSFITDSFDDVRDYYDRYSDYFPKKWMVAVFITGALGLLYLKTRKGETEAVEKYREGSLL